MHRVMARARGGAEQAIEQGRPMRRQLVELQVRSAGLGDDRHQPRAGRRLEHQVSRADLRRRDGEGRERRRRGELVQRDLLLAAAGVGQGEVGDASQQRRDLGRRVFQTADLRAEAAQLKHERGFHRVVGVAPRPGPIGVRAAERSGHHPRHQLSVQGARAVQVGDEGSRGGQGVGGLVRALLEAEEGKKGVHGKLPFARGGGRLPPVPPGSRSPFPASLLSAQATGFPARPQSVTKDGGAPKVRGSTRFSCACADLPHRSLNESTNSRTQIGRV